MNDAEQRAAAKQFAQDWQARGDEKQDNQSFWLALLQKVFGVAEPEKYINFEYPVLVDDGRKEVRAAGFLSLCRGCGHFRQAPDVPRLSEKP